METLSLRIFQLKYPFDPKRWFPMKVRKEKKFISPISCIEEKFGLQKVGVVAVFLY